MAAVTAVFLSPLPVELLLMPTPGAMGALPLLARVFAPEPTVLPFQMPGDVLRYLRQPCLQVPLYWLGSPITATNVYREIAFALQIPELWALLIHGILVTVWEPPQLKIPVTLTLPQDHIRLLKQLLRALAQLLLLIL